MILMRQGSKKAISRTIINLFPVHEIYIEPFFGAGGLYFYKRPPAAYNILNDLDDEIFNFFQVIKHNPKEFESELIRTDISMARLNHYKRNEYENNPLERAIRFLFLSNFTFLSKGETLKLGNSNHKEKILTRLGETIDLLKNAVISNKDWQDFLTSISFRHDSDKERAFIYADPPYIGTRQDAYRTGDIWTENRLRDLVCFLCSFGSRFGISEFDSPGVLQLAKEFNLNINYIQERQNLKNRRTEILLTNYNPQTNLFE